MEGKDSNRSVAKADTKTKKADTKKDKLLIQPSSSGTIKKTQLSTTSQNPLGSLTNLSFAESVTSLQGDMESLKSELDQLKDLSSSLTHIMSLMERQERYLKEHGMREEEPAPKTKTE